MNVSPGQDLPSLDLAWIDVAGLALVSIMLLLGAMRGLWWQVIRFLGLLGAVALASSLSQRFSPTLVQNLSEIPPGLVHGVTWTTVFLAGLTAAAVFGLMGRRLLETMNLGLVDRAGGALVGLATGFLIHIPLVAVLIRIAPPDWAARHVGGSLSARTLETLSSRWNQLSGHGEADSEGDAPDPMSVGQDPMFEASAVPDGESTRSDSH